MLYRVTLAFPYEGQPPSEAAMDATLDQLRQVAPDAGPVLDLTASAMNVTMAFDAKDEASAEVLARAATGAAHGGGGELVAVEPVAD